MYAGWRGIRSLRRAPFWIGSHFEQGLRTGIEQQIEKRPGRSQCQGVQFVGHSEHEVEVVGVRADPAAVPQAIAGAPAPGTWGSIVIDRSRGVGCFVLAVDTFVLVSAEEQRCGSAPQPDMPSAADRLTLDW